MDLFASDDDFEDRDDEETVLPDEPAPPAHPRLTAAITGHHDIERQFLDYFAKDRMPHALIFSGPSGIGKATMAYRLARFLLKHGKADAGQDSLFGTPEPVNHTSLDVSASDPVFSKVAASGHSDLLSIERPFDETKGKYKDSVLVDDVRKIAPFLRMTAAEGGWRVVVVDDADTMTRGSQNALLKILEEPPPQTVLILVAHRAGALLPTIRSRSRLIDFKPLPSDQMKELLASFGHRPGAEEFSTLMALTQGSPGKALQIMAADGLTLMGQILDLLARPAPDWPAIHKFSDAVTGSEHGFELFAELMPLIYNNLARAMARKAEPRGFGMHRDWASELAAQRALTEILDTADALEQGLGRISHANLDKRQGVLTAFAQVFQ